MTQYSGAVDNQRDLFLIKVLPWIVCILASLFYCYEFFLRVAPSVMTSELMSAYGIGADKFGTLSAVYYYIYTPMQLPVGVLMDRYGPRRLLSVAILLCALGSFLMAGIPKEYAAVIGRFFMGFGSAFAFVGVLKLAVHWLPANRLAMVSGITTALGMVGAIFADDLLTVLVNRTGWQQSWFYAGVAGIVLMMVFWLIVRDNPPHHKLRPTVKRETKTWGQALRYLFMIAKNPQMWVVGLIGTMMFMPITVFGALWGVSFLKQAYHFTSIDAGSAVSMIFWGCAIGGPLMGWFSDLIKRRRIILQVGVLLSAVLLFVLLYVPGLSELSIYVILFLTGFIISGEVLVFAMACEISSPKAAGTAVAGANFLVTMGGMIFQPVAGWILAWGGPIGKVHGAPIYSVASYQYALLVLPVGLLISFVLSLFLKETFCRSTYQSKSPAH